MNDSTPPPASDHSVILSAGAGSFTHESALPEAVGAPLRAPTAPQFPELPSVGVGNNSASIRVEPFALPDAAPVPKPVKHSTSRDVIFRDAPKQWVNVKQAHALLLWCREQSINDVTMGTGRRIIGKRHGSYRPIIKDTLTSADMDFFLRTFKEGAAISLGDTYRGRYRFLLDTDTGQRFRLRVTASHLTGSAEGQTVTLRLIPDTIPTSEQLDIPQHLLDAFDYKYGLGFVCGKMESGKTWTVAALLHERLARPDYNRKILHFGSPIEFLFDQHAGCDHIFQYEIPETIKTYPDALKMAKSATPDLMVLEEVNDLETMSMIIDAAQSGIAVKGTLHISRVSELPLAMQTYFPDADQREGRLYSVAEALRVILVQRLEPAIRDGDPTLHDGRVCVREYLEMDEGMRSALLERPTREWPRLLRKFVSDHGCSMIDSARLLHTAGRISDDTMTRIETGRAT